MGINMGVYIGLVCLLLACQGVVSRDSQNSFVFNSNGKSIQVNSIQIDERQRRSIDVVDAIQPNATTLSPDPMTVTRLVTKELVFTCDVVNSTTTYFKSISSINIIGLDEMGKEQVVATINPKYGPITYPPYKDETLTGAIFRHPADPETRQTSGTGHLKLSISYPTLEQIYSLSPTKKTMCKVFGMIDTDDGEKAAEDKVDVSVNVVEPTFQSLGGRFVIEPENIKPLLSEKLTVGCHFKGIEAVKTIKQITIAKDRYSIAYCDAAGLCVAQNKASFPNASITGGYNGTSGNVILTVNYPREVHSGSFECLIYVDNQEDMPLYGYGSDMVEVVATDPTLKDLVKRVHGLVLEEKRLAAHDTNQDSDINTLEIDTGRNTKAISALETHDDTQDTKIKNNGGDITKLRGRVNALETHDNTQDTKIQNNEQNIKTLQDRINARCGGAYTHLRYGICYAYVTQSKTWSSAQSYCSSIGGYLAEPRTFGQEYNVFEIVPSEGTVWIGGFLWTGHDTKWRWSTSGDNIIAGKTAFTYWASGQPDNYQNKERCLEMDCADGKWNDNNCDNTFYFVCQRYMNYIHN